MIVEDLYEKHTFVLQSPTGSKFAITQFDDAYLNTTLSVLKGVRQSSCGATGGWLQEYEEREWCCMRSNVPVPSAWLASDGNLARTCHALALIACPAAERLPPYWELCNVAQRHLAVFRLSLGMEDVLIHQCILLPLLLALTLLADRLCGSNGPRRAACSASHDPNVCKERMQCIACMLSSPIGEPILLFYHICVTSRPCLGRRDSHIHAERCAREGRQLGRRVALGLRHLLSVSIVGCWRRDSRPTPRSE